MDKNRVQLDIDTKLSLPEKRENLREWIAKFLMRLFMGVVLAVLFVFIFEEPSSDEALNIQTVLSSVMGILGVVIGFYFGQTSSE